MNKKIKIYGERNTNTNYISKLIQKNLYVDEISGVVPEYIDKIQKNMIGNELLRDLYFYFTYEINLGWKHSCVRSLDEISKCRIMKDEILFLTITKNPYSWLLSLYRRPYHQYGKKKSSFESFLESPWKTVARDNCNRILECPIELWNIKNRSYFNLKSLNCISITTESIFANPEKIINEISDIFFVKKKMNKFSNVSESTKENGKNFSFYRDYYLNEKWKEEISQSAISIINRSIDKNLMNQFGYEIL